MLRALVGDGAPGKQWNIVLGSAPERFLKAGTKSLGICGILKIAVCA